MNRRAVEHPPALRAAIWDNDLATINALLKDTPDLIFSTDRTNNNWTPLHAAARYGRKELTELLLAYGAEIDNTGYFAKRDGSCVDDILDDTPLHLAAIDSKDVVELLLAHGADVNKMTNGGTPLHTAARYGNRDTVELLLAHGADANAKKPIGGETPLHEVVRGVGADRKASVVELLLAHGADVNTASTGGRTPLDETERRDRDWELAELMLANKATPTSLRCDKCGTVYTLGADTSAMTSGELAGMMPGLIGRLPTEPGPDLMLGRTNTLDKEQLRRDRVTILRRGPKKGWTCQKCHHDNPWQTTPAKGIASLNRPYPAPPSFSSGRGTIFGEQPPTKPWWKFWL